MLRVPISIAIVIACLWSEVAEATYESGSCPSLLQHGKQHSLVSSEVDGVGTCPRIMQRLQAFDSSDLLDACKTALADTALCLQAEQELRQEGKPCDVLDPIWGQLQARTHVLLLERRSRKREGSSLVKRSDGNQKDDDAAATSGGDQINGDNATKGSDNANATGGSNSTSNGTAEQGSGDGRRRRRRRKTAQDAEQDVWDLLLSGKDYNHARTEPIPSNHKSNQSVSNATTVDNNKDLEDAMPSNETEVANSNQSSK